MDRRLWTHQEDQAIKMLVEKYGNKKWTIIAEKLPESSGGMVRSGKQCRERWHNHLDPSVNKSNWSEAQEALIFEAHKEYGNKWKQISKFLVGRTDNDIKNHFYSVLRRSLRRINKYLGLRNSTGMMREIKPSVLSKILNTKSIQNPVEHQQVQSKLENSIDLTSLLFEFSSYKPKKEKKQNGQNFHEKEKEKLEVLIKKILSFKYRIYDISSNYERQKKQKKQKSMVKGKKGLFEKKDNMYSQKTLEFNFEVKKEEDQEETPKQLSQEIMKSTENSGVQEKLEVKIEQQFQSQNAWMFHDCQDKFMGEINPPSICSEDQMGMGEDLVVIGTQCKIPFRNEGEQEPYFEQVLEMHYNE